MSNANDLITMLYWIVGIIIVIFIIDWFWYKPFQENKQTELLITKLRQKNKTFYQTLPKFNAGRGIVIFLNDSTMLAGSLLVITLRRNMCKLPILVCYTDGDLSDTNRKFIEDLSNTRTMEISSKCDVPLESLRGTQARVYALIYSPFEEVLLLEPEMLFFGNPEYLFNDPLYTKTGALFWKDRKIHSYWDKKVYNWVRRLISYRKDDNRILDKKAGNYQSRDILLINKNLHKKSLEKLWTLTKEWEIVYSYIPGDKECYWIATELAKEPYSFVEHYPGVIGEVQLDLLCGHTLYLDSMGKLLGWNGSLGSQMLQTDFTHFAIFDHNSKWNSVLGAADNKICLKNAKNTELPEEIKNTINEYAKIMHDLSNQVLKQNNDLF